MKSPTLAKRQSPTPKVIPRRTLMLAEYPNAWPAIPPMLTIEDFADYMQLSRTLIYQWKRKGILKRGRHYIQLDESGRSIRIPLREALIERLLEDSLQDGGLADNEPHQPPSATERPIERRQKKPALSAAPRREKSSTRIEPRGNASNASPGQESQGPPGRCPIDPALLEKFLN